MTKSAQDEIRNFHASLFLAGIQVCHAERNTLLSGKTVLSMNIVINYVDCHPERSEGSAQLVMIMTSYTDAFTRFLKYQHDKLQLSISNFDTKIVVLNAVKDHFMDDDPSSKKRCQDDTLLKGSQDKIKQISQQG